MHINTISSPLAGQRHYVLATDGACKGNPGTGGWGVIIQLKDGAEVIRQSALAAQGEVMISTNNQMELLAVVNGLEAPPLARPYAPIASAISAATRSGTISCTFLP